MGNSFVPAPPSLDAHDSPRTGPAEVSLDTALSSPGGQPGHREPRLALAVLGVSRCSPRSRRIRRGAPAS